MKSLTVLAVVFLTFLNAGHYIENRGPGKHFKQFETDILQATVTDDPQPEYFPVIVDVSSVPTVDGVTDRAALDRLIQKLDQLGARTIGIDIDFSPLYSGQPVTPDDWNYFDKWARLTKEDFQIHLGVYRQATAGRASWLGRGEFAALAVGIAMPTENGERNLAAIEVREQLSASLRQIATALYLDMDRRAHPPTAPSEYGGSGSLTISTYRVNYSDQIMRRLEDQAITYRDPHDLDAKEIAGKAILIGNARGPGDQFCRPFSPTPTSGLLAHAASLVTLRQGGLQEIDQRKTQEIDWAIFFLMSAGLVFLHWWHRDSQLPSHQIELFEKGGFIFCAMVILSGSVVLAWMFHTFFPDFLWTAATAFIHPYVGETLVPVFVKFTGALLLPFKNFFGEILRRR